MVLNHRKKKKSLKKIELIIINKGLYMKNFLAICSMAIMMCMNVNAQNEWEIIYSEGDELKDIEECYANYYSDKNGDYFVCFDNSNAVLIGTENDIFDCLLNLDDYKTYITYVIVGFYKDGELFKKETTRFYAKHDDFSVVASSPKIGKKIIKHLKETGDVRIIACKYGKTYFDILLPMNKDLK